MVDFDDARFAVIADIHGNADALLAVLDDIETQSIHSVINLGDHVSGPLAPRECADILMALNHPSIKGNHDRWVVETAPDQMSSIDRLARDDLDAPQLEWLRAMPASLQVTPDVFACHGTPASDNAYWLENVTATGGVALRPQAEIATIAKGISAQLFLCGHSHIPRRIDLSEGRIVLNPGSVGCPAYRDDEPVAHIVETGTAAACYAVVERRRDGWLSSFRHVPYDGRRMLARAAETGHAAWMPRLATGWLT
ncbi:MAG: metallophosphoesterase family protein [Pseudomonadota bacterium]